MGGHFLDLHEYNFLENISGKSQDSVLPFRR